MNHNNNYHQCSHHQYSWFKFCVLLGIIFGSLCIFSRYTFAVEDLKSNAVSLLAFETGVGGDGYTELSRKKRALIVKPEIVTVQKKKIKVWFLTLGHMTTKIYHKTRWPNHMVPYVFDDDLSERQKENFNLAAKAYEKSTAVRFVALTPRNARIYTSFLVISGFDGDGDSACQSPVGNRGFLIMQHKIVLSSYCDSSAALHEIGHTLGLGHEHERMDRDQHVDIHYANIIDEDEFQFKKVSTREYEDFGAYDLDSIMHYSAYANAIDRKKPTITYAGTEIPVSSGRSVVLSQGDIAAVNAMYPPGYATYLNTAGVRYNLSVGESVSFDLSSYLTLAMDATLASVVWNFGDGHEVITASATVVHTYDQPGNYRLSVIVQDTMKRQDMAFIEVRVQ